MNENRGKVIVRTSIVGIVVNVLLSAFKLFVGTVTNSIAITMDAVNNVADAASSIITIIGTKLAGKEADRKHPFGYGRIEYFSALIIGLIVLYAGITALQESVQSILHPETPSYTTAALIIVAVGVVAKVFLGRYFVRVGKKVDSGSLVGSGQEATLDSVISLSTLVAAGVYMVWGVSLEAYLAAIIALVIIKSGIDMLRETISRLLGEPADATVAQELKATIREFPEVNGVYDLILNDYGPDYYQASCHIEIPDTMSVNELDKLIRAITDEVYAKHHIAMTAIGIYSKNSKDEHVIAVRNKVAEIALGFENIKQIHGFFLDEETKSIRFDLVVSFDADDRRALFEEALAAIQAEFPDYTLNAAMDAEFVAPKKAD